MAAATQQKYPSSHSSQEAWRRLPSLRGIGCQEHGLPAP